MSHHSSEPENVGEFAAWIKKVAHEQGAGATGQFPRGHLNETDEGEIGLAVTVKNNTVILAFGKSVSWIGLSRVEAVELAELLKRRAQEL